MLVLDRRGVPLADVSVDAGRAGDGRTDATGRIVFEEVYAGDHHVRLVEPGFVYGTRYVRDLQDGETRKITLREGPWYDLDVYVRDEAGAPAQYARLDVDPDGIAPWVHMVAGVQTLTVMTDSTGRCRLPELPWVDVEIDVRFGSRKAHVELEPGAYAVTLTLGSEGGPVVR